MKKPVYIKCPRCELNYIFKKDNYCEVCKQEMRAGALIEEPEFDELEEGLELCPICKLNYLTDGESVCPSCQEENMMFDKDTDANWRDLVDKANDEDEELDLLPVEEEIDEELDSTFAKDLEDEFEDDEEDLDNDETYEDLDLDFDDDLDDVEDDEEDEEEDEDDEDDDF